LLEQVKTWLGGCLAESLTSCWLVPDYFDKSARPAERRISRKGNKRKGERQMRHGFARCPLAFACFATEPFSFRSLTFTYLSFVQADTQTNSKIRQINGWAVKRAAETKNGDF